MQLTRPLPDRYGRRVDEATLNWGPTPFGKATLASSMPPEEALVVGVSVWEGMARRLRHNCA